MNATKDYGGTFDVRVKTPTNIPISWFDAQSGNYEPANGSEAFLINRTHDGLMTIRIETPVQISESIAFIRERTIEARVKYEDSRCVHAQCGECRLIRPVHYWYGGDEPLCRKCSAQVNS